MANRPGRWMRGLGLALLALALTLAFLVLRFPTDALGRSLAQQVSDRTGVRIEFGQIESRPLGIKGLDVRVTLPSGERVVLDSMRVYPACSPSWLMAAPAFWVDLDADDDRGDIEGILTVGTVRSFVGELRNVDLSALPTSEITDGFAMTGRVDGTVDLVLNPGEPTEGELSFQAQNGTLTAPNMPLPLPFARLNGEITLGGEHYADVHGLQMRGPEIEGDLKGHVAHADNPGAQPLDMKLTVRTKGQGLRPFLNRLGVRLRADGSADLTLSGTLSNPKFR